MKLMRNVLVLVVVLGLAGFASAQDAKKKEKPAQKAPAALAGVVVSVADGNVTIKTAPKAPAEAKEVVVETNKSTVVTIDGKDAKVGDLVKGMRVKVTPIKGTAEKIVAMTAKPKAGKAPAKQK